MKSCCKENLRVVFNGKEIEELSQINLRNFSKLTKDDQEFWHENYCLTAGHPKPKGAFDTTRYTRIHMFLHEAIDREMSKLFKTRNS